ncbi:MAG: phosphatase PAP2 family protein [Rhodospirillaceae bacterium]|nr:phosphatase PAP2 family protein [Rhodospirillaceae bacterium]
MRRVLKSLAASPEHWLLALLFVLMLLPFLDIPLSTVFYMPETPFRWQVDGAPEFVRDFVPEIIMAGAALCVVLWAAARLSPRVPQWFTNRHIIYLVTTLLVGPGVIVETLLKPNWGRARPKDITAFGGDAAYTWPWQVAQECASNCSFVSGHAAIAFWLSAYAFLLPSKWRPVGLAAALVFGFAVGLARIAQGGHFFSDIAAAGFIVVLVNVLFARALLKPMAAA